MGTEMFTELRPALLKLARRMLGSEADAEDKVQETYLRWRRSSGDTADASSALLTTILTRLCLNHLKLARVQLEHENAPLLLENMSSEERSPADRAEFADALSEALTTVLGNLSSTERVVFILREAFEFDYSEIAAVVDRSEENCRQILKRARERLAARESSVRSERENEQVVWEFLNAAETGQFEQLLKLLTDDAALAPAPGDLLQPAPPLIHDRKLLFQTLGNSLAQMRSGSERLVVFQYGQDFACVARRGTAADGAVLLRMIGQRVAGVRLVKCPALLKRLQIVMTASNNGETRQGIVQHNN